jgi:hypothetical protein
LPIFLLPSIPAFLNFEDTGMWNLEVWSKLTEASE